MTDKKDPNLNEHEVEAALAEELDEVAPRRDLWPSIRAGVRHPRPKTRRRWLVPAFGSAVVALLIVGLLLAQPWEADDPSPGEIVAAREPTPEFNPTAAGGAARTATAAPDPTAAPEAADLGPAVFLNNGCSACHSTGTDTVIGPGLGGLSARSSDDEIRQSITDPSAVVTAGFSDGIMPGNFGSVISADDLDALIQYLQTLE